MRSEPLRLNDVAELPLRPAVASRPPRTILIRHGGTWQSAAILALCLLLTAVVLLGHRALAEMERQQHAALQSQAASDRRIQELEAAMPFDSRRRRLLLGMRDHILKVNPRVSVGDAYRYAELALRASEKYPSVDPLLLLAIGTVESRYELQAISPADARGLYQIWPSTGRLLLRGLGWEYDDAALHDPEKNTEAAALYLDILFSTYGDPQMVLAEYNGGPLNAGYFRAGVNQLASETRNYVPQVLATHARLKEAFAKAAEAAPDSHRDLRREGKTLAGPPSVGTPAVSTSAPRGDR